MTSWLLILFVLICLGLFFFLTREKENMIQYPFLSLMVYIGWVLPQLIGLVNNKYLVPSGSLNKLLLMTTFCIICIVLGDYINKKPLGWFQWSFSNQRLLLGSTFLSLFGFYFFFKVGQVAEEISKSMGGAWSGPITLYIFFSKALTFGFVIAMLLHFRRPSLWALSIIVFDMMVYLHRIIYLGRRAAMVEFFAIILLTLWFQKRWMLSRSVILVSVICGTLIINSIGEYRKLIVYKENPEWHDIVNIDFVGNIIGIGKKGHYELRNAAFLIESSERRSNYDFGIALWDDQVFSYVPAQIVGARLKKTLMLTDSYDEKMYALNRYKRHPGTTITGIASSFSAFWYFGALIFLVIAFLMNKFYLAGLKGNFVGQFLTIVLMSPALHAITHSTHWFFKPWLQIIVFVFPIFLFSRNFPLERKRLVNHRYDSSCETL